MWPIPDWPSADFAETFYKAWLTGPQDDRGIATAAHVAVRRLRDRYRKDPLIWAAYVHAGA
jgi:hypothetical protein